MVGRGADANAAVSLNDAGVAALKAHNYALAIEKFRAALKLDPSYQLALDNLSIAYSNYGLQLRNPKEALRQFHEALYLNHSNPTITANMNGILKIMGKNPHSFEDRVTLGDESKQSGDYVGADLEYREALKIRDNSAVRQKLEDAHRALKEADIALGDPGRHDKPPSLSEPLVDFGTYMADVQRRIRRVWFPPQGHESDRVVVVFKIHRDGNLSDLRIDHSSGFAPSDQAAEDAVRHASLFGPLPAGSSENVDIQFMFDLDVFNQHKTSLP